MPERDRIAELERDLAEAIERQSATGQVLEVLGRCAFELDRVFETVVGQAVRLCRADAGLIYVREGDVYRLAVALGASQAYRDYIAGVPIQAGPGTLVGRVGQDRQTVQIRDAQAGSRVHDAPRARCSAGSARCSASRCSTVSASSA